MQVSEMKRNKKLKILAASDLHNDTTAVKRLAETAEKEHIDLVVLCGDISFSDSLARGMIRPFLDKGKKVIFVPGNHDVTVGDIMIEKYNIKSIHGYGLMIDDVGFFGCGGANIGPYYMSESDIWNYISNSFRYVVDAKKKVMVTHVQPDQSTLTIWPGSKAVRKAIKKFKPDLHICGHIHEAEGLEEKIDGVRSVIVGPKGKIFEI